MIFIKIFASTLFFYPLLLVTKFSNRGGTARGVSRNLFEVSHGIPLLLDTKFSNRGGIGQEDLGFQEKICKHLIFIPFSWTRNFEIVGEYDLKTFKKCFESTSFLPLLLHKKFSNLGGSKAGGFSRIFLQVPHFSHFHLLLLDKKF